MPHGRMKPDAKHPNRYWGALPLPKAKSEFFNAVTTPAPAGDGTIATIRMYGPIDSWGGYWGISAKDVGAVLDALPDSVTQIILRINSPGGEVFEGMSILNMFRAHKASVTAVVDALAASAASFVAAGCDETVMSPGTQMMIHSPWTFSYGNASDLRKDADVLDTIERGMVEIYTAKAGEKDWAALLADEVWMTATEAVAQGLADRVAVVPDSGETDTVGAEDTELILLPDEGEPEDSAARVIRIVAHSAPIRPPSSIAEPGSTNREDNAVTNSNLAAGIRERLGVTDAAATDETLLAALDEALSEQPTPKAPEGAVIVDANAWAETQAAAAEGRQALAAQASERRDRIVDDAVREGRIPAASRETWRKQLDTNEDGIKSLLDGFAANTVPVAEVGHSDEPSSDDSLYNAAWGDDTKEA